MGKSAAEDYEDEDKSIKTHGMNTDTLGEAIHRSVLRERDKPQRDKMIDSIQSSRYKEHR